MRQHNFQTLNVVILSFNFKFILDEKKEFITFVSVGVKKAFNEKCWYQFWS